MYINMINISNNKYHKYLKQYINNHIIKMDFLLSPTRLKYPFTIIYPFGQKIYSISIRTSLLVVHVDRAQFQDSIHIVDTLIANNSRLLNDRNIQPKQWWKSRDRVDRSIGNTVNQINLYIWDLQLPQSVLGMNLNDKQIKIFKFIYAALRNSISDPQKLKNMLANNSLNVSTTLFDDLLLKANSIMGTNQQYSKNRPIQSQNLLLLTYQNYTVFPFQANINLRERAIYRVPSVDYIREQMLKGYSCKLVNMNCINYLVNSGNDLPETQKSFYRIKENFPMWKGIVGRKPLFKEFYAMLQSQAFLYMGHGAGSTHIKQRQFYGKNLDTLLLLFGCSSASLTQNKCEPNGIAHSHLINKSPGVLGCLWEVTDKDTDKVTDNIFKSLTHHPQNLSRIMSSSKKKCKHQFLNGGAIVIFGIPIYVYCH